MSIPNKPFLKQTEKFPLCYDIEINYFHIIKFLYEEIYFTSVTHKL